MCIRDSFYSGDFQQNDILAIISSPTLLSNSNQTIRHVAENILEKLKFLQKGSKAPVICLKDKNAVSYTHLAGIHFYFIDNNLEPATFPETRPRLLSMK